MKFGHICTSFLGVMLVISVALPNTASAKRFPPITGKLSKRGYTVLALSSAGDTTSVRVKGRSFKLRPPAKGVTLHLRAPDGAYAGPVVVASPKNGKRAILGVKAGVKLGNVKVKGGKGYAKVQRKLPKKFVVKKRKARAKKGVPIGAGNFGLVGVAKLSGPRSDPDLDGVPSPLDIDDDGDLVLDDYDRSPDSGASAAQVGGTFPDGSRLHLTTSLGAETRQDSVNVDGGSTPEQIAAAQQKDGHLNAIWAGIDAGSGELDCGTLIYCSAGGTGRFSPTAGPPPGGFTRSSASPFPECCDSDGDGLGSLIQGGPGAIGVPGGGAMAIFHGATSDQIRAGDMLIARGTFNGEPVESPASVGFVFSTFPVLAAYSDGQGDSSTFSYSPGAQSGPPPPVRAGPGGDIVLKLTFWRPQRPRIAGDPGQGQWMDVGNLYHLLYAGGGNCPQSSFSEPSQDLAALSSSPIPELDPNAGGFLDLRGDLPSDPANTFNYTFNLTQCLAANGETIGLKGSVSLGVIGVAIGRDSGRFFTTSWAAFAVQP